MRKLKRYVSKVAAFSMAALLTCSGIFGDLAMVSKRSYYGFLGTEKVLATETSGGTVNTDTFSWDNASVYFLLTDRFRNGDTSNDHSYNRGLDKNGNVIEGIDERGTFHGGDFAGITQTIKDGYFNDLGINALWISAPYEQIHGYVVGDNRSPSFAHYSYHGYYVLDYTNTDANFGTAEEFKELVDTAHEHGIRVIMDVVMNHAGYNSLYDMNEYGFGTIRGWENYYYQMTDINNAYYHSYIDYQTSSTDWAKWWGPGWIRAGLPGYTPGGDDNYTMTLNGLPDFKTESTETVGLPAILETKWKQEGRYDEEVAELTSYLSDNGYSMTVTNCISYWLSSWVREYGVDGFRCDTAKHVELSSWRTLHDMCTDALKDWKSKNPDKKLDDLDFWMTGECWDHNVSYGCDEYFTEAKFDSMINFETQGGGMFSKATVASKYDEYAAALNSNDSFNALSFISSHDTDLANGDRCYLGSALMLLPGGIQVYYGDETNRGLVPGIPFDANGGAGHSLRSDMNWDSIDKDVLAHWKKVGTFRNNHIAVGAGENISLTSNSGIAFARTYAKNGISDRVAACIGAAPKVSVILDVSGVWEDGSTVINYYDNSFATVTNGTVTFDSGEKGTVLVGDPDGRPIVSITGDERFKGTQQVTISIQGAESAIVSVDGAKKFIVNNGDKFTIGETAYDGDKVTVSYEVANEKGNFKGEAVFYKEAEDAGGEEKPTKSRLRVNNLLESVIYVYAWEEATSKVLSDTWPGTPFTQQDSEGYFYCEFDTTEEYSFVINGGSETWQTGDITGIKGDTTIEVIGHSCKIIPKKETKLGLLKQEARKVKNMTPSDYTTDSWNVLYGYIDDADALIALGEDNADAEAISELYDEIVLAKSSLILAKPVVTEASVGLSIVKGTAAYGANVTVEINGKTYDAIADEITGEWEIDASELIRLTDVIYVSAYRDLIQSEQLVYDMSGNDNQQLIATLKVGGSTSEVNLNVGNSVQLDVEATGGSGSYTYKYVMKNMTTGTEIVLKNYSSASSYTGPLTSVGTKKFTVYVKDSEENEVQTNTVTVVVSKAVLAFAGSLEVNGSTGNLNLNIGNSVNLAPKAVGGKAPYTYKYVMQNVTTGKSVTLKDYSSASSYTGPLTTVGTKKFTVYVKDSDGNEVQTNTVTVVAGNDVSSLTGSLKVNGSTANINLTLGADVTLVTTATGGSGSYTYKYVIENVTTGKTVTLKDYSSAASYKGTLTSQGIKKFTVYVKDSTGVVVVTNTVTVVVGTDSTLAGNLEVNGSTANINLTLGAEVTLVPTVTGGSGSYTYRYVIENVTIGKTVTLKDYSSATSYTGAITSKGTKKFTVYVKDSNGAVVITNTVMVVVS